MKLDELKTNDGKIYKGVTIREVTLSQVKIFHESGATSILLSNLPAELQKEFDYDPEKAAAFAQGEAEELRNKRLQAWLRLPVTERYSIKPDRSNGISLRYEDYDLLVQEEKKKAEIERSSPKQLEAGIERVPKGGKLVIEVNRSTIGAANTEFFLAIVTDPQGKEMVRRYGPDDIAETPSTPGGAWWNLFIVNIPEDIGAGVKIIVVDRLDNKAANFTLQPTIR